MKGIARVVWLCVLIMSAAVADPRCKSADIWGARLVDGVCWSCVFPIKISGATMGSGRSPSGSPNDVLCTCEDELGLPEVGLPMSYWNMSRMIEVVTTPYCSPIMGGTIFAEGSTYGGKTRSNNNVRDSAFYNYHYYSFPLFYMLDLMLDSRCNADGYIDFDLLFMSELDPCHNDDELCFFLQPEASIFANPLAQAACASDCAAATAGEPQDSLFWCAGCWGSVYPMTGNVMSEGSGPRATSLVATRALASLHRKGFGRKTVGREAMCGGYLYPMLPKSQYKMSMLAPVAEADTGNCCHEIGASTFAWGEWRNLPGYDYVYTLWRWEDCCYR